MPQEQLNGADVGALFQEVDGEGVPQGVLVLLIVCIPPRSAITITPVTE